MRTSPLGPVDEGTVTSNDWGGWQGASKITLGVDGAEAVSVSVWAKFVDQNEDHSFYVALWNDSAGSPSGDPIAVSEKVTTRGSGANEQYTVDFSASVTLNAGDYWVGVVFTATSGVDDLVLVSGGTHYERNAGGTPSDWTGGVSSANTIPASLNVNLPAGYVNVLSFNGSTDKIVVDTGVPDAGYGTYLAVCKLSADAGNKSPIGDTQAGNTAEMFVNPASGVYYYTGGASQGGGATLGVANGWGIIAVTKATGLSPVRSHALILSTQTWTHGNGGSTNDSAGGSHGWWIGAGAGDYFPGSIFLVAWWSGRVLTDAELESITGLNDIYRLGPTGLLTCDQGNTTLLELMGTGADQTSISGTTVVQDTIPNFDVSYQDISQHASPEMVKRSLHERGYSPEAASKVSARV